MLNLVIFGAPGSGKGTQSEILENKLGIVHVSTGDMLRKEISEHTQLGVLADSYMKHGKLVPDEVVVDMLEKFIDEHDKAKGIAFDGFPRTLHQGEALDKMLAKHNQKIGIVISLEVEDSVLIERMIARGAQSGRSDDNRQTIENRLKVYYSQTEPLKDFYEKQGKLVRIKGHNSIEEIASTIENEIQKHLKK